MKKDLGLLGLCLLLAVPAAGADADAAAHFHDPVFGFSVDLPSIGDTAGAVVVQRLLVAGPSVDGFAPNCYLQIQYTAIGLDALIDLTRKQFESYGFTLVANTRRVTSGAPATVIEYTAKNSGRSLRHLALAVAGPSRIWLLTCTSLDSSFAQHRPVFSQIIDSFALTPEPTPQPK